MCCFVLSVVAAATSFSPSLFSPPFLVNYDCMSRKKWQREMGGGMGGCGKMLAPLLLPPSLPRPRDKKSALSFSSPSSSSSFFHFFFFHFGVFPQRRRSRRPPHFYSSRFLPPHPACLTGRMARPRSPLGPSFLSPTADRSSVHRSRSRKGIGGSVGMRPRQREWGILYNYALPPSRSLTVSFIYPPHPPLRAPIPPNKI